MTGARALAALATVAGALLLPACAQSPKPTDAPQPAAQCDATRVQGLVGQPGTDALAQAARQQAGATTVRLVRHDQMVTREYRQGRLTLWLDADGRVREVNCG